MTLTKPCHRPGCTAVIVRTQPARLREAQYCSRACAAQHRVALGLHPFRQRTAAQLRQNAKKGGRARAEQARKARLLAIAATVRRYIPTEWEVRFGAREIARVIALAVRAYQQGHEDGYQAGHTAAWRKGRVA